MVIIKHMRLNNYLFSFLAPVKCSAGAYACLKKKLQKDILSLLSMKSEIHQTAQEQSRFVKCLTTLSNIRHTADNSIHRLRFLAQKPHERIQESAEEMKSISTHLLLHSRCRETLYHPFTT